MVNFSRQGVEQRTYTVGERLSSGLQPMLRIARDRGALVTVFLTFSSAMAHFFWNVKYLIMIFWAQPLDL